MKNRIRAHYENAKAAYLRDQAEIVPQAYRSNFVCFGGASEVQYIIWKMIPKSAKRILVVGVFGGRDYFGLKVRGVEVHGVDLKELPEYENLSVANVEEGLPFPDQFFDAIVMNEVLEHLVRDYQALNHLKRVLKDDGVLVMSVPFLHEAEPTHVRVHTRRSVERLLLCCGYTLDSVIERPGLGIWPRWVNWVNHGISILLFAGFGRTIYPITLPLLWKVEYWSGRHCLPWRRYSRCWGGYFAFRKAKLGLDYISLNKQVFCHTVDKYCDH